MTARPPRGARERQVHRSCHAKLCSTAATTDRNAIVVGRSDVARSSAATVTNCTTAPSPLTTAYLATVHITRPPDGLVAARRDGACACAGGPRDKTSRRG